MTVAEILRIQAKAPGDLGTRQALILAAGELEAAAEALAEAKKIIQLWHSMRTLPTAPQLTEDAELWELYQASPEMKRLNEAIVRLGGTP